MFFMHRKNRAAMAMAAILAASLFGNTAVSADDVSFGDSPLDSGYEGENVEAYDPNASYAPETSAPETSAPETSAPETSASQTEAYYPPETNTYVAPTEPQWTESYDNGGYDSGSYSGGYDSGSYDGGYSDGSYDGGYQEDSYEGHYEEHYGDDYPEEYSGPYREYSGDASTLGPDLQLNDFELFYKEDAERDFALDRENLPDMFFLKLDEVMQEPELPTGCEVTALSMVLRYLEFDVDKVELAEDYLLYNREDDNMALGYIGDPFSESGAGCFAPAIAATADYYFAENDANYRAYDISDTEMEDLYAYVAAGTPVLVWSTMYMQEPTFQEQVSEHHDHTCRWYNQEHCVVLTGYDFTEGTVQINDPLEGIVQRDMEEFAALYEVTGKNAVVIKEQPEDAASKEKKTKSASSAEAQTEAASDASSQAESVSGTEVQTEDTASVRKHLLVGA